MLVKSISGSAGLRLVGMIFGFLVGVQLARGLGPEGYGIYGTAMAIISLLMIPTEMGLPQLVTREVAAASVTSGFLATRHIVRKALGIVARSTAIIVTGMYLLLATGFQNFSDDLYPVLLIGLLWIPAVAMGNINSAALVGQHQVIRGQIAEILIRPAFISVSLFLIALLGLNGLDPSFAMAINVLAASIAAMTSFLLLRSKRATDSSESFAAEISLGQALPMALSEGLRIMSSQVGILVLAIMANSEQVGLYRVANGIFVVSIMPSFLINVVLAPTISKLFTEGRNAELEQLNIWISIFLLSVSLVFLSLGYFFGNTALAIIFGVEYEAAAKILVIFLAGEVVASVFGYPMIMLNMMRHQRVVMWWSTVALACNCVVSIILVHRVGPVGAAYGSAFGMIVWRAGCSFFAKRRLGLNTSWATKLIAEKRENA